MFVRQRLGDAEDVVLVEEVAVGELGRAGHRALLDPGRPGGRVAGEGADVGAERDGLLPVEVARGRHHHVAELVLAHEQQVDDAHDPGLLQLLELRQDLALEAVAGEREARHLDRPHRLHHGRVGRVLDVSHSFEP